MYASVVLLWSAAHCTLFQTHPGKRCNHQLLSACCELVLLLLLPCCCCIRFCGVALLLVLLLLAPPFCSALRLMRVARLLAGCKRLLLCLVMPCCCRVVRLRCLLLLPWEAAMHCRLLRGAASCCMPAGLSGAAVVKQCPCDGVPSKFVSRRLCARKILDLTVQNNFASALPTWEA